LKSPGKRKLIEFGQRTGRGFLRLAKGAANYAEKLREMERRMPRTKRRYRSQPIRKVHRRKPKIENYRDDSMDYFPSM
jgi:hypothetical protein